MRVTPGQSIPFWLKLSNWDGITRYVVAHLTALDGTEQPGSPYLLTYSGNRGIYAGAGPNMGISDLRADYEIYDDAGLTIRSRKYLDSWEDVVADISVSFALSQILGKLSGLDPNVIQGYLDQTIQQGLVDTSQVASGNMDISETEGTIENSQVAQGEIDTTALQGEED